MSTIAEDIKRLAHEARESLNKDLKVLKDVDLWVPSGVPSLDIAMGGGFPVGRLTTLIGEKSVGKSTLGVKALANTQRLGGIGVWMDIERSGWLDRSKAMGLDPELLIFMQPDTLDSYELELPDGTKEKRLGMFDALEKILWVIRKRSNRALMTIVGDSVAGSSVAHEMDGDVGDAGMGIHARIVAQGLRKIMPYIYDFNVCLILVNQMKESITRFGSGKTYIAKKPLDFHSAITLEMSQKEIYPSDKKSESKAIITRAFVSKNKVADPLQTIEYFTWYDRGIDQLWECINCLDVYKLLGEKTGYVVWEGKSYRKAQLYASALENGDVADKVYRLVDELIRKKTTKKGSSYYEGPVRKAEKAA